jgi:hypothetical protein
LAALVFFFVVQLPLSRFSAGFAFVTCFVVFFIDQKTKMLIFDVCRAAKERDVSQIKMLMKKHEFTLEKEQPKHLAKRSLCEKE